MTLAPAGLEQLRHHEARHALAENGDHLGQPNLCIENGIESNGADLPEDPADRGESFRQQPVPNPPHLGDVRALMAPGTPRGWRRSCCESGAGSNLFERANFRLHYKTLWKVRQLVRNLSAANEDSAQR